MPLGWTDTQKRKYEHIVDSVRDRGVASDRAREIAARTINKERARKGQTKTASRSSIDDISSSRRGAGFVRPARRAGARATSSTTRRARWGSRGVPR